MGFYLFCLLGRRPRHRFLLDNQPLEFFWTLTPTLLLILLSIPSLSLLYLLDEVGSPSSTYKVIGHQWYWFYEQNETAHFMLDSYLRTGPLRLLNTDSSLNVHYGLVLRFLITGADVLHSWTVPSWGLKADAVPG